VYIVAVTVKVIARKPAAAPRAYSCGGRVFECESLESAGDTPLSFRRLDFSAQDLNVALRPSAQHLRPQDASDCGGLFNFEKSKGSGFCEMDQLRGTTLLFFLFSRAPQKARPSV
jgi:hypothetical protein